MASLSDSGTSSSASGTGVGAFLFLGSFQNSTGGFLMRVERCRAGPGEGKALGVGLASLSLSGVDDLEGQGTEDVLKVLSCTGLYPLFLCLAPKSSH